MFRLHRLLLATTCILVLAGCDNPSAATDNSTTPVPSAEQAMQRKQQGDLAGAAAIYSEILARNPGSVETAVELASLHRKLGQADKALALMQTAQSQEPANPQVLAQLGYALIDTGEPKVAVNVFDQLMAIRHQHAAAYNGKAVAFDHTGNHLIAQELYRRALEIEPDASHIKNNLAMSMILNGQASEAITILEPLYASEPGNNTVRHNLAMAYGLKGNNKKAMELNLIDHDKKAAEENLRYYKQYAKQQKLLAKKMAQQYREPPVATPTPKVKANAKPAPAKPPIVAAEEKTPDITPEDAKPSAGADMEPTPTARQSSEETKVTAPSYPTKHGAWSRATADTTW